MSGGRPVSPRIPAIETRYAGCRFRSRLEARWAVFFDALDWTWEYEPEGFELPSGRYLPDFRLNGGRSWFEVKPFTPKDEGERWSLEVEPRHQELAVETGLPVLVAFGMHRSGDDCWGRATVWNSAPVHLTAFIWPDGGVQWSSLLWVPWPLKSVTFERAVEQGLVDETLLNGFSVGLMNKTAKQTNAAWDKASSARFEFGEAS